MWMHKRLRSSSEQSLRQLALNEYLMAFLDDIYVAVTPQRVRPVYDLLATHLPHHARLNQGQARVWNAAGTEPPNIASLGPDVWVGNPNLPATHQGLTVLGAPVGSPMFVSTSSNTRSTLISNCCNASPRSMTSKHHGCCCCCCSFVPAPAAPTCYEPRPHVSNNSRSPCLLVVMGRHSPCPCPSSPTRPLNNSTPTLKHLRRSKPQRTLREP